MKKQRCNADFKQEAAKLILRMESGIMEVSGRLGLAENVLYRLRQKHHEKEEANALEVSQSPKAMAAEIGLLGKELDKQKRMTEILQKLWATSSDL